MADYLDKRFDMSILDTPSLLAVTDPAIVGKYAGMILLAVRYGVTHISEVKAAQKITDTNGLKITGYGGMSYQYEY